MQLEPGNYRIYCLQHSTVLTISKFITERDVDIISRYIVTWRWSYSTIITEEHTLLTADAS